MFVSNNKVQSQNSRNRGRAKRQTGHGIPSQQSSGIGEHDESLDQLSPPLSPHSSSGHERVRESEEITDYTKTSRRNNGRYSLTQRLRNEEDREPMNPPHLYSSLSNTSEGGKSDHSEPPSPKHGGQASVTPAADKAEGSPKPASATESAKGPASGSPIEGRISNAAKNWEKIRLANKMANAFKEVNEDIQKLGAVADDEHIDWSEVYRGNGDADEMSKAGKFVIDPHGSFRITWDIFMSIILLYIAFYVPYRVCLYWDDDNTTGNMKIIEYMSDGLFGVDILLNFITAYHDSSSGVLVTDNKKIAIHYLKTYFFIDLVASFPFGLCLPDSAKTLNKAGKVSRLPRLIKFLRLMRLLKLVRVVRLRQFVMRIEHDFSIHHGVSKMLKIIFIVLLVTHLVGCLWYMIGRTGGEGEIDGGWQWRYHLTNHTLEQQYVTSLYWAFSTLTTVGYGDISARTTQEQIYSMLMMLLGVSWYAYIVSSMSTIMGSFDRQNKAVKEKMNSVNAFIQDAKLPAGTAKHIRRYYDFALSSNKNKSLLNSNMYNADQILDELSSSLRAEVLLFVERELISKIPFLTDKIPQFVADVITMLQPMVFQEGDFVIKEGSAADEMYFLVKGRCAVYYGNKKVVSITEGSYFGEVGCIMGGIRRAGIKALTLCEVQALNRRNLNILLAEYPDVGDELKKVAYQRANQVRNSNMQKKQVAGVRKMLEERDRIISLSPKEKGRRASPPSVSSSKAGDADEGGGIDRKESFDKIDAMVKKSGGGSERLLYSPPKKAIVAMTREMSVTSGFGKQGTGGGARSPTRGGRASSPNSKSALEVHIDKAIESKSRDANAKLLEKMESITASFLSDK